MQENRYIQEDEIDLRELFKIIWDKKIFIILFTLAITVLATVYAYSKAPIYEVKSYVEIGYINKERIEDIDSLEQKLKVIFGVEAPKYEEDSFEKGVVSSIKQIKGVKNFLEIKTEALSNDAALSKNKDVLKFIQDSSQESIKQYEVILDNTILNKKREIDFINEINIKNIKSEIEILKEQELKNIDRQIYILKSQNIDSVNKEISLLKTQEIPKIKTQIAFLTNSKIKSLEDKISFYSKSLNKYIKELDNLNKSMEKSDNSSSMIASVQMLNYQNLITNAQNQIKDLELQVEVIQNETIPNLKYELENITTIKTKELENKKANILNVDIKDLENQKLNLSNEKIRKLEDKINIELQTKISQLNEEIDTLSFKKTGQNLSNTKLVGEYLVNDFPVKPKKKLIVAVAFVTGFIISIFLVFLFNFIKQNANRTDY
ncbi:Wzz/FepE/Etk N-terminal domain-containing protein [Aliarcobacter butzleri]|uniref:Wzz/FepE/Etk N-terminal domain-containing protein n=1 Tax=Aliarcobacter butzleri TaxID=28197 RepID=UPI0021B6A1EF|nr:Wzz/FepE/Etk N-terminal domain-containing protein [Aliarcobacter butzleri]MCT7571469.1 Wzz/FepE/Etk N-terminal domain-containing protein [Aliarcobacter butzleri]MCT7622742.1 Wzz/FepE/Etk N-terminal domain-containing protein [Aliarcobacter butzleri]